MTSPIQWLKKMAKTALGREPFVCRDIRVATQRLGSTYGGWHVVPDGISPESVVYSFGIGEDISFDTAFIATYGTTVHAFDPTPKLLRGYEVKTCQRDWSFTTTVSQPLMVRSHFIHPRTMRTCRTRSLTGPRRRAGPSTFPSNEFAPSCRISVIRLLTSSRWISKVPSTMS